MHVKQSNFSEVVNMMFGQGETEVRHAWFRGVDLLGDDLESAIGRIAEAETPSQRVTALRDCANMIGFVVASSIHRGSDRVRAEWVKNTVSHVVSEATTPVERGAVQTALVGIYRHYVQGHAPKDLEKAFRDGLVARA